MPAPTAPFPTFDPNNPVIPEGWDQAVIDTASELVYSPSKMGNDIAYFVSGYAEKVSTALIEQLSPIITTGVIIYFIFSGWMTLSGRGQNTIGDTVATSVKISFIAYFGLNAGNFTNFVIPAVSGIETLLSQAIGNQNSSWIVLDTFYYNLWYMVADVCGAFIRNLFQEFSFFGDDGLIELVIIFLFVSCMAVIGSITTFVITLVLLACNIGLPIVLGFGPLFICTLMFPVTRQWFDGWLRTAVGLIFTMIIAISLVTLLDHITSQQITAIKAMDIKNTTIAELQGRIVFLIFVMATILVIYFKISTFANSLVGGMSLTGLNLSEVASIPKTLGGLQQTGRMIQKMATDTKSAIGNTMAVMFGMKTPGLDNKTTETNNKNTNSAINNIINSAANTAAGAGNVAKERAQVTGAIPTGNSINSQASYNMAAANNSVPKAAPSNVIDINAHRAYGLNSNKKTG